MTQTAILLVRRGGPDDPQSYRPLRCTVRAGPVGVGRTSPDPGNHRSDAGVPLRVPQRQCLQGMPDVAGRQSDLRLHGQT